MFSSESEMTTYVSRWMQDQGLIVKSEFSTPWGICDLVGLAFNKRHVARRLRLRQTRAIGSITQTALLLQIPDVEEPKKTSLKQLVRLSSPTIPDEQVDKEIQRLVAGRFVVRGSRGGLQKLNGWIPLQKRLVAVELKLLRVEEAMNQALNNLGFASESYVGLPADVASRVKKKASRWAKYFEAGVGLVSVAPSGCRIVARSHYNKRHLDQTIQLYSVEKFWRTRFRGS